MSPLTGLFEKKNLMNILQSISNYFRSSWDEAKKVSWPSQKDTVRFSTLVIGISIVTAIFFATLDAGFSHVVDLTIALKNRVPANPSAQTTTTTTPTAVPITPALDITPITTSTK